MSYSPASIVTSGALPNLVAIHYEREAVPELEGPDAFFEHDKTTSAASASGQPDSVDVLLN